jgi:hypothetical protein
MGFLACNVKKRNYESNKNFYFVQGFVRRNAQNRRLNSPKANAGLKRMKPVKRPQQQPKNRPPKHTDGSPKEQRAYGASLVGINIQNTRSTLK